MQTRKLTGERWQLDNSVQRESQGIELGKLNVRVLGFSNRQ